MVLARLNPTQAAILQVLRENGRPMSAYAVLDALKGQGISAPPTVYRALARLREVGLVHRIESLSAFIACACDHGHEPAAFAICDHCGAVMEFDDPAGTDDLRAQAKGTGFIVDRMTVELHGRCGQCAGAAS